MKKAKEIGFGLGVVILIIGLVALYLLWGDWTIRYKSRLDRFFGKGNWQVISKDWDYSRVAAVRSNASSPSYGDGRPGRFYRNWNILCENKNGEEEVWELSNHTYKMNQERYRIYSSKRFRARQALTQELMWISFAVVEEEIHNEIVSEGLTEEEAYCIYVDMSYHDGNPPRKFYDKLAKESWFTVDGVTAGNYLASDLYDFYLVIQIHEYRLEKLSEEGQENVINSLANIEKRLLETYGENASFEIMHGEHSVTYADGVKQ